VIIGGKFPSPLVSIKTTLGEAESGIPQYSVGITHGGCVIFLTYAAPASVEQVICEPLIVAMTLFGLVGAAAIVK
jgi:hypothetical protein